MIAVETTLRADGLPDDLGALHSRIASVVPAGVGKGHESSAWAELIPPLPAEVELTEGQRRTTARQFGSLGSGNHFVEVCLDERDAVWVVLHSGSRGIGNQLAMTHIEKAKGLMKRYFIELPDPDLAYLVEDTGEFDAYIAAMLWAQRYALANRSAMMDAVLAQLWSVTAAAGEVAAREAAAGDVVVGEVQRINCHHNFTTREHHRGRDLWITRKGAIRAATGDMGVIPGSMGTRSYIVRGRGVDASYHSCSHGAGRRLSRSQARRTLSAASLTEAMSGTTWNAAQVDALLDEHPDSYKDIDRVMADQSDLVEVVHTLHQVLNYKGT